MRAFRDEFKADDALTSVFDERIERALRGVATHFYQFYRDPEEELV